MALHHKNVDSHPEQISKLWRFEGVYNCRGLEFPVALNKIGIFEQSNNISVNVLVIGGGKEQLYILRTAKFSD